MKHKKKCNEIVGSFRKFLNSAWEPFIECIQSFEEHIKEDFIDNWLQFNWELLVEYPLCDYHEYLQAYWNGADCNGLSDRVLNSKASATHKIICTSKTGTTLTNKFDNKPIEIEKLNFQKFVSYQGNTTYLDIPPFNFILLEGNEELVIVEISEVIFKIVPI